MYNNDMRTTVTLDPDVHEFALYYASARGITLSAAMNELVRKAENSPGRPEPVVVFSPEGFPMFPPLEGTVSPELVKKLEEEEIDPKSFT
jgi:hypothetical protein